MFKALRARPWRTLALLVLAGAVGLLVDRWARPENLLAKAVRIQPGMTEREVEVLLGRPTERQTLGLCLIHEVEDTGVFLGATWKTADGKVIVVFDGEGVVVTSAIMPAAPASLDDFARWLNRALRLP
jgi:hypothetical protein